MAAKDRGWDGRQRQGVGWPLGTGAGMAARDGGWDGRQGQGVGWPPGTGSGMAARDRGWVRYLCKASDSILRSVIEIVVRYASEAKQVHQYASNEASEERK